MNFLSVRETCLYRSIVNFFPIFVCDIKFFCVYRNDDKNRDEIEKFGIPRIGRDIISLEI